MANKTYVALLTGGNDIKWVTGLDNETRTAYWKAGEPAKPFTKRLAEDLAAMLRCNGHPAVTISAPNWRSFENGLDWFGTVRWCDDDIRVALEDCGIEDSAIRSHEDMVDEIHVRLENHHALTDLMTEAGWEIIHYVIRDYLREREEGASNG